MMLLILLICLPHLKMRAQAPMTCSVRGKIVKVMKPGKGDHDACAKYPCRAMVKILQRYNCGSSVTTPVSEGSTVEMQFAYTLHATQKLFPKMKATYPGLKKGSIFSAEIEQHVQPGKEAFVVYGYKPE